MRTRAPYIELTTKRACRDDLAAFKFLVAVERRTIASKLGTGGTPWMEWKRRLDNAALYPLRYQPSLSRQRIRLAGLFTEASRPRLPTMRLVASVKTDR
jgi:hypothetical protein